MYAIVDIETTGGSARLERITEIAIYIHDGEKIVDEYSTLVNPERGIPYFITSLTGISNEMVEDAPKFFEVARKIVEITEGKTFVAHNAGFDYGFLKEEFKSLGYDFSRKQLCTVRLSRKLIPGLPSYGLGNICKHLGITINSRHRAAGDALATVQLFEHLLSLDTGNKITKPASKLIFSGVNPFLDLSLIHRLPEEPGVYYFHNENGEVIYVGKSKDIRKRVITHFGNEKSMRSISMKASISDISYEKTGSELIALLLESDEIKKLKPIFNRAQRRSLFNNGLYIYQDQGGFLRMHIAKTNTTGSPVSTFSSMDEAKGFVYRLVEEFQLCQKLCGLYESSNACFHFSIGQCRGACCGKEPSSIYNKRVEEALSRYHYQDENFVVIDRGRHSGERSIVMVENGKYLGFGYTDVDTPVSSPVDMKEFISFYSDNRDTKQIIRNYLRNYQVEKIVKF
jgi:DNA polymerase III subunit epsilon